MNTIVKIVSILALVLLGLSQPVFGQGRHTVSGQVLDTDGNPVVGAFVRDKAGNTGVSTNADGRYRLEVSSENATLDFSCLGFVEESILVKGKTTIDLTMKEESTLLEGTVITALGIKREAKSLGYAIAKVTSKEMSAANDPNVMTAISGKVAGVDISGMAAGPSGSTRVIIRGNSQLTGSNQPLYVIDGIPVDNTTLGGADKWGGFDYGDIMSSLNPNDIESISVLKGPSAAALYGSKASNGVILITTKSATHRKGIGVEFNSQTSVVSLMRHLDDYQQVYGQGTSYSPPLTQERASRTTQNAWGGKLDPNLMIPIYNGELKPYGNVKDNIFSFFRTGVTTTNSIALEGSGKEASFRFSYTDMRNSDIIPKSGTSRQSFALKGTANLGKRITLNASANYSIEKVHNRPALSDDPRNVGYNILGIAANFDQKWLAENYKTADGKYIDWNGNAYRLNPYWVINEMPNESSKNRLIGSVNIDWNIARGLDLIVRGGLDTYSFQVEECVPIKTPLFENGRFNRMDNTLLQWSLDAILKYERRFGKWDLSTFAGGTIIHYDYDAYTQTGENQIIPGVQDVTNYYKILTSHSHPRKQVNSLYGQFSIGYGDWIYIDATLRNDVSSTLNPQNRSYFYPSVSGSFVFSNLLPNASWLTFGKLRTSWALVGGDTNPYQLDLLYSTRSYTINGIPIGGLSGTTVPNYNLRPTSTNSFEVGLEARFLDDRLGFDLTFYRQITTDQIIRMNLTQTTGYEKAMTNAGRIDNQGFELLLTGVPVKTSNFRWSITANMARNRNKIVSLHPDQTTQVLGEARNQNVAIHASEGGEYGAIVGASFKRNDNGEIIFKNGLPLYDTSLKVLGNGNHDLALGLINDFRYGNFSLGFLIDMKFGGDIYSQTAYRTHLFGTSKETLEGRAEWLVSEQERVAAGVDPKDWTATGGFLGKGVKEVVDDSGNVTYVPNDVYVNPSEYWSSVTTNTAEPFIYDNTFIKLRELTFSYSLPSKWLVHTPLSAVSVSLFGRNLWTIYSNLKNVDPESSYNGTTSMGVEMGSLPTRRSFGVGLNIKF